ncbi:hypothetical protein EI74_0279 [Mycoplasma testudineum]|uniref:Uncharacterized protein n=1 Tax=Mycoplasma testudineum TaxID=244584 RepID=A0A4R6IEI7_9MOLU|nr:hypothetical protein CG473_01010 [Mycoplasma testudineum]TDO20452.1 hypothetical protein EI74_0279 [Mycoplasma testudineum]
MLKKKIFIILLAFKTTLFVAFLTIGVLLIYFGDSSVKIIKILIFFEVIIQFLSITTFIFQNYTKKYKFIYMLLWINSITILINIIINNIIWMVYSELLTSKYRWFIISLLMFSFIYVFSTIQLHFLDAPKLWNIKMTWPKYSEKKYLKALNGRKKIYNKFFVTKNNNS